ncbi:DUF1376 domain-containing protein [Chitinophaga sp. YIM B06452]|uniref:DUF1376 domain-containing protein n=1 Tax=Chitinophaga sp. YIM B06452 TaxID=3082158 RepID=UPI0031FE866C
MEKPFFKFYPNDWLSAPEVILMTPAEEGAYIRLIALCWKEGGLPDDDDQLAVLSRLGKAWTKSKDRLRACFVSVDGRLQHKRLLKEWEKHEQFREKQRTNGQRGGRPKKTVNELLDENEPKGLGFFGLQKIKPKKSYSSSSSYSEEIIEGENPPTAQPQSGGNAKPKKTVKPRIAFLPPSEPEVTLYFSSLKTGDWTAERIARQAERFYNHYSSNGWRVGKNPMKDWQAAVRNWVDNDFNNSKTTNNAAPGEENDEYRKRRQEQEARTRRRQEE